MTTTRTGHTSSRGWSPTNPRIVTYQKDVYYKLGIWNLDLGMVTYHPLDGHPSTVPHPNVENRWKMMEFDTEELILVLLFFIDLPEFVLYCI